MNLVERMMPAKSQYAPETSFSAIEASEVRQWLRSRIAAGRNRMVSETVQMTPVMAQIILDDCNKDNRGLRLGRVAMWSKKIKEGKWRLTSQGISFTKDGILNNGQHRLHGIVQSDHTVAIYVTFGEERDVFDVLDTGSNRSGGDVLAIAGFKNTAALAAAARTLNNIERGQPLSHDALSNDDLLAFVDAHRELEAATIPTCRVTKAFRCSSAGVAAALYLISQGTRRQDLFCNFIDRLIDGAHLGAKSPVALLRTALLQKTVVDLEVHPSERSASLCAQIILVWNQQLRPSRKGLPKWDSAAEPFPVVE